MVWGYRQPDNSLRWFSPEFNEDMNYKISHDGSPGSIFYFKSDIDGAGPGTITYNKITGEGSFVLDSESRFFGLLNGRTYNMISNYLEPGNDEEIEHISPQRPPQTLEILSTDPVDYPNLIRRLECPICLTNIKNIVLIPCGHTICSNCYPSLNPKDCPICRGPIKNTQEFYLKKYIKYKKNIKNYQINNYIL